MLCITQTDAQGIPAENCKDKYVYYTKLLKNFRLNKSIRLSNDKQRNTLTESKHILKRLNEYYKEMHQEANSRENNISEVIINKEPEPSLEDATKNLSTSGATGF